MQRRQFLKATAASAIGLPFAPPLVASSLIPCVAALFAPPAAAAQDSSAGWRNHEISTLISIAAPKTRLGAKPQQPTRIWLPLPLTLDTDYQRTLSIESVAAGAKIATHIDSHYQARLLEVEWPASSETAPLTLQLVTRIATRDRHADLATPNPAVRLGASERALWLEATELLPTDGSVKQQADAIMSTLAPDADTVTRARAIYDWVVEHTFREPKTRGCGIGDVKSMLESGNLGGKCADINAVFVALARAAGIPARDVYGVRVAASARGYKSLGKASDITRAQHCRAEFFADGFGWIPVDPADVRKVALEEEKGGLPLNDPKVMAIRDYLFGNWEMNWIAYNYAHDLELPGSALGKAGKIGFLMYPNGETADGRLDSLDPDHFSYRLSAREITA